MFTDNEVLHICTVASNLAKQKDYESTGTSSIFKKPTSDHPRVVVGVQCRDIEAESLHVVLLIINDNQGRRLRCVDLHPGAGNWGGSLICAKCDAFYPVEPVKQVSTQQTTSHSFEYELATGTMRIAWDGGQTVLSQEEVRDLLVFLHDDLRESILSARQDDQAEKQ